MIRIDSKAIQINGELTTIISECTTILKTVYSTMVDTLGEEDANYNLVKMGRLVVMPDEDQKNERIQG